MPKRKQEWSETGGSKQRAAKHKALDDANGDADEAVVVAKADSQAVWHWLQQWSWGKMSSIHVQTEAIINFNDYQRMLHRIPLSEDWMPIAMHRLAQMGTWGAHPGNINRELKHWLGEPTLPKAMMVSVPMVTPKPTSGEGKNKNIDFPILLPHEVISHVYHKHPTLFLRLYIGEDNWQNAPGKLEEFWTTVEARQDPRLIRHPMQTTTGWQRQYVPLSLHGDGVPVTKIGKAGSKSMDVYSSSGLLGMGTTRALKLYCFGLFTHSEVKDNKATMNKIWNIVMWSFEAAFTGKFPTHDVHGNALPEPAGKDLAGGMRFVLWSITADIDHVGQSLWVDTLQFQ